MKGLQYKQIIGNVQHATKNTITRILPDIKRPAEYGGKKLRLPENFWETEVHAAGAIKY